MLQATARIPCRPLSYANVEMAYNKEFIVDYTTGVIYIKKADGAIIDVSTSIQTTIIETISKNPDFAGELKIKLPDGTSVALDTVVLKNKKDVEDIQNALGYTVSPTGVVSFNILQSLKDAVLSVDPVTGVTTIKVDAANVAETATRKFVTPEEKLAWSANTHPAIIAVTVTGGDAAWTATTGGVAPYTQRVDVAGILESDTPIVDIKLGDVYDTVMKQLDSYAFIYKILTYNGYIIVYASQATLVNINLQMKVDR